ncbi:uncharacterized protein [Acropora muricata]|uniref:uncharacterized protein isoform X2 n=1 Tax=Acropora muricata TaxID=159855 RepID=UPI0034E4111F
MPSNQAEKDSYEEAKNRVVNLSNRHLKRIERLSEGLSPLTLLLSSNEISRVENLQYFAHLQQLSLARNHIDDMKGISSAQGLRVLDLSDNNISHIEGVSSLINLEWLNLSGNDIEEIAELDKNVNLYHLDLSENSIAVISGLGTLMKLKTLLLHGNLISSLAVIQDQLSTTVCTLSLADNDISDLNEMRNLTCLVNLEQLSLVNNPCVLASTPWRQEVNYRPYLVHCCATLRNLDGCLITSQERFLARLLNQAFYQFGLPSPGQHHQLIAILQHVCAQSVAFQNFQDEATEDLDEDTLLESESHYIPVPPSEMEQPHFVQDDPIMTEEEALRLLSLAATLIQAHVRGYLVRKKFDFFLYRRKKNAANCIQAAWKGYRARTRDIKVVNIRNELRIKRMVSVINNLYSIIDREHDEAVKSREKMKNVIKYLWSQIEEQKRANQRQRYKERQIKAAVAIQAWWRECLSRKIWSMGSNKEDDVCTLFGFCRHIQMQLDLFKSKLSKFVQGKGLDSFPGLTALPIDDVNNVYGLTYQRLDHGVDKDKANVSSESGCVLTETTVVFEKEAQPHSNLAPRVSLERERKRDPGNEVEPYSGTSSQIDPLRDAVEGDENQSATPLVDQMVEEVYKVALRNTPSDEGLIDGSQSNLMGDHQLVDAVAVNDRRQLNLDGDQAVDNVDPRLLEGEEDDEDTVESSNSDSLIAAKQGPVEYDREQEDKPKIVPFTQQEDPRLESEACYYGDEGLEEKGRLSEAPFSVVKERQSSGFSDDAQKKQSVSEGPLDVTIPEIIVSSPVHSGDESCGDHDGVEVQAKVQVKVNVRDNHIDTAASTKSGTALHKSNAGEHGKDVREQGPQSSGASEEVRSRKQCEGRGSDEMSRIEAPRTSLPNLGERASNLLSQLRSEIESMKSARLSGVLPIIAPGDEDTAGSAVVLQEQDAPCSLLHKRDRDQVASEAREISEQSSGNRDTSEPPPQELDDSRVESKGHELVTHDSKLPQSASLQRDTYDKATPDYKTALRDSSQLGPASIVTYRLPLFEDVDSACSSLSLDDLDPDVEEAPSHTSE